MSTEPNSQSTSLVICDHFDEQKCDHQCFHSKPHVPVAIGYESDWAEKYECHCNDGLEVCGWRHDAPACICVPCETKDAK